MQTEDANYAHRLQRLTGARWKQALDVQRPYRWKLRRMQLGRVLDVGCGLGRNLANLEGSGVGVDHNPTSVRICRDAGYEAYTADDFLASSAAQSGSFDTLLLSHVAEHLDREGCYDLIATYLPFVREPRRLVVIVPQRRGWASDPTHVRWLGRSELADLARHFSAQVTELRSFPFPGAVGQVFKYNETVLDCAGAAVPS